MSDHFFDEARKLVNFRLLGIVQELFVRLRSLNEPSLDSNSS